VGRMNENHEPRLGIDIGRVIIDGSAHPAGGDTAFFTGDEAVMLATPEMAGAFDAIARLAPRFGGRVWLVSKCGPRVQARTLRWLAGHDFHGRTGVPAGNVRFCRTRPEKRIHCEELGLTHFVDDQPDVHTAIDGTVEHQYLFGTKQGRVPRHVVRTRTWAEAERLITATLTPAASAAGRVSRAGSSGPV
jgi:tRNA(Leu) C34 or U34 (ribose-2'-O)-methylase TrmL